MVQLYPSGKPGKDIIREYDLTSPSLDKRVNQSQASGSFKEKGNLSPEEQKLNQLRKEIKHLQMENDSLKQVALRFLDVLIDSFITYCHVFSPPKMKKTTRRPP